MLSCLDFQINVRQNDIKEEIKKAWESPFFSFSFAFLCIKAKFCLISTFSFTEIISVVPEIWSTSLQTIQQLGRKIFAWVKTTGYFK